LLEHVLQIFDLVTLLLLAVPVVGSITPKHFGSLPWQLVVVASVWHFSSFKLKHSECEFAKSAASWVAVDSTEPAPHFKHLNVVLLSSWLNALDTSGISNIVLPEAQFVTVSEKFPRHISYLLAYAFDPSLIAIF